MQELLDQLYSYLIGIWRYRWYALIVAWLICLASWPVIVKMPDQYQATAKVYVDTDFILPDVVGVGPLADPQARLQAMSRTLLTRPNLEEIIRITDLDLGVNNASEMRAVVNELQNNIKLDSSLPNRLPRSLNRSRSSDDIFTISYNHKDPQLAKNIVQAALTSFVEKTLRRGGDLSAKVEGFLDQRIAEKEIVVRDLEAEFANFKRDNVDLLPASGQTYRQYIVKLEEEREAVSLALQKAQKRLETLQREVTGDTPSIGIGADLPLVSAIGTDNDTATNNDGDGFATFATTVTNLPEQLRLQNLEQQLDELLLKYTSKHPDVISTQQVIAGLRQQVNSKLRTLYDEYRKRRQVEASQLKQANKNAEEYRFRLKYQQVEARSEVEAQQIQLTNIEQRLNTLREKRDLLPTIETKLRRLESELSLAKGQLTDLKARQKKVELGIQVENEEDIRFDVIEPPFVPTIPVGPNRPVLFSGVLGIALAIGLALAFIIAQIRPTFDTRRNLSNVFQAPVLGSVSAFWSPEKLRRQRLNLFVYCCLLVGLFALYAGLMLTNSQGLNITLPFA